MKRTAIKSAIALLYVLTCSFPAVSATFLHAENGGLSRNADGEYEISSSAELVLFSQKLGVPGMPADGTYVLTRDIDMSEVADFSPIRGFTGRFDGRKHAIRNLSICRPEETSVGLFSTLGNERKGAAVENLALENVYVRGSNMVGGIAGTSFGTIRRCMVSGEVVSVLHGCGGIVGRLQAVATERKDAPVIEDCISSASVVSLRDSDSQGGISGRILAPSGEIRRCIATGEVSGLSRTGGLVGQMVAGAVVRSCVAANRRISSNPRTGLTYGVAGDMAPDAIIENVLVWDRYREGLPQGTTALSAKALLSPSSYVPLALDPKVWTWNKSRETFPALIGFRTESSYFDFTWQDIVKVTSRVASTLDAITVTLECDNPRGLQFAIERIERGLPQQFEWSKSAVRTFTGLKPATAYELCYRIKSSEGASRWYRLVANTAIPATADPQPRNISAVVTSDPATSMIVAWTTLDTALHAPVVAVRPVGKNGLKRTFNGTSRYRPVNLSVDKNLFAAYYNFHSVMITGLEPATRYAYTVSDAAAGTSSSERYFTTASREPSPFRFAYVADPQLNNANARSALTQTFAHIADIDPSPAFVYFAGDMAEKGYNCAQMDWTHECADTLLARSFIVPAHGNHDETEILLSYYPLPAASPTLPATYSFSYGDVRFTVLNTELSSRAEVEAMARLLEEDHARNARRRNIVMLHKALYAATDHVDDKDINLLREILCPVFERLGIDAVLMGHDHCFTRSFVLNGFNAAPDPVTDGVQQTYVKPRAPLYIVNGTSGTSKWYKKIPYDAAQLTRVAPDYTFVDKCSSDYEKAVEEQSFSMVSLSEEKITIDTYFFRAARTDKEETPLYLYDSITIKK